MTPSFYWAPSYSSIMWIWSCSFEAFTWFCGIYSLCEWICMRSTWANYWVSVICNTSNFGRESSIYPLNASSAVQVMPLETLQLNNGAATFLIAFPFSLRSNLVFGWREVEMREIKWEKVLGVRLLQAKNAIFKNCRNGSIWNYIFEKLWFENIEKLLFSNRMKDDAFF